MTELEREFEGKGYAELKSGLAAAIIEFLAPLQERYRRLAADPGEIARLLEIGADKAQGVARKTLTTVYDRVGFLRRGG